MHTLVASPHTEKREILLLLFCCFGLFFRETQNKRNIENKMVYYMNANRWMNEAKDIQFSVHLNKHNNVLDRE